MPIESATWIEDLDPSAPSDLDDYSTADDHLNLIKQVLQNQLPNLGAEAVNATAAELNILLPIETGSFVGTLTGYSTNVPTPTVFWRKIGGLVKMWILGSASSPARNSTNLELTGVPAAIRPSAARWAPCLVISNNIRPAYGAITVDGRVQFAIAIRDSVDRVYMTTTAFVNTAGVDCGLVAGWSVEYPL